MKKELREQEKYLLYFSYFLNEGMNDFIKIIKSLENSVIDGVTETVKHEIKKQKGRFLWALLEPLAASLVQTVTSP